MAKGSKKRAKKPASVRCKRNGGSWVKGKKKHGKKKRSPGHCKR